MSMSMSMCASSESPSLAVLINSGGTGVEASFVVQSVGGLYEFVTDVILWYQTCQGMQTTATESLIAFE